MWSYFSVLFVFLLSAGISTQLSVSHNRDRCCDAFNESHSYREIVKGADLAASRHDVSTCAVPQPLLDEIASYQTAVSNIIAEATQGSWKGRTYRNLAKFVDKFGARVSGSQELEDSIDYVLDLMRADGMEVHAEEAMVPHWVRGEESAELILPRRKKLAILGLGSSVGTSAEGITADVLVVSTFEELHSKADQAAGKIIVYNQPFSTYGSSVQYRGKGAAEAAKVGGVAALVRSITPVSLDTPHTGGQIYDEEVPHVPAACITVEDAELLHRLQQSGETLRIKLIMLDYNLPMTTSRNGVGELRGTTTPDESVILSGHIDSWDIGQGAMDDGGGVAISWEALALLKSMNLIPKRTLRAVMWTAEETGLNGAQDYARHHASEASKIVAAFESDYGTFTPLGLDFAGTEEAGCIVYEILKLFSAINATRYERFDSVSTDISFLIDLGIPGLENHNDNDHYFWYHHTEADTMSMMDSDDLDKTLALWAGASYVIASLNDPLPRAPARNTLTGSADE